MGKRSKDKGGGHERDICRQLSLWLSRGERRDLFTRNVLSGGAHTRSGTGLPGDVAASHPLSHGFLELVHVECKHWEDLQVDAILWRDQGKLRQVMAKLEEVTRRAGQTYLLVARQNFRPDLAFLPYDVASGSCSSDTFHHLLWNRTVYATRLADLVANDPDAFIREVRACLKRRELGRRIIQIRRSR